MLKGKGISSRNRYRKSYYLKEGKNRNREKKNTKCRRGIKKTRFGD